MLSTLLIIAALTAHAELAPHPAKPAEAPAQRANVLVLYADDLRPDALAALGHREVKTPRLDALIAEGTAFTQAHCMGSRHGAVCIPSRAMLLTGRSLFRCDEALSSPESWPEQFAEAGYVTFATGKWHNGAPSLARMFQSGRALFLGGMTHEPFEAPLVDLAPGAGFDNLRPTREHPTKLFTDAAVEFLRSSAADRPFFAYVAFNLPHDPRVAPREFHELYDAERLALPPNFAPQHPFDNGDLRVRDEQLETWPRTPEAIRGHLADYYASISFLDAEVGRILDALRDRELDERTIVVFAGDHGLAIGSHGLMGKQNLYEHSTATPLVMRGPGIPRGERRAELVYLFDVLSTVAARIGVEAPEGSEGLDLFAAGEPDGRRRSSLFTAYGKVQRAMRDRRWKLIEYPEAKRTQLFDLEADPHETHDLSQADEHRATLERMRALLERERKRFDDPLATRAR